MARSTRSKKRLRADVSIHGNLAGCAISPDTSGQFDFQIAVASMPTKIKLCDDAQGTVSTKCSFNTIRVYVAHSDPPKTVAGQPSASTSTGFTLNLQAGAYEIVMVLNFIPGSKEAFIFEDCGGLNQLTRIPLLITPAGHFSLRVS
jgi:hypothetical protein